MAAKHVVIIGGGIAGLTAAHELIEERGFQVTLIERRERLGGKASSKESPQGLPAEHGFRFFPGWYRHVPDTMKRIRYKDATRTVLDNLVAADTNLFASYSEDLIPALLRLPRTAAELGTITKFPQQLARLGLSLADFMFFLKQLADYARTPEEERVERYDGITWAQFMNAGERSPAFQKYLVDGITRNTIAAKPDEASAHTVAQVALRTLFDTVLPDTMVDRVLNGPTSEVWIDPWRDYLEGSGVEIITDAELMSFEFVDDRVAAVRIRRSKTECKKSRARLQALRLLRRALCSARGDEELAQRRLSSRNVREELVEKWERKFLHGGGGELEKDVICAFGESEPSHADPEDDDYSKRDCIAWVNREYEAASSQHTALMRSVHEKDQVVKGDYFVLALPVEQAAFYVNRSEELRRRDPALVNLIRLSEQVDWMAGIQFYLTENVKVTPGHIDCLDSEWHITAISQAQFWPDIDLKERGKGDVRGKVKTILSVDIAAWDVKGTKHRKAAYSCTRQEIAEEVWDQLRRSLNRPGRGPILLDRMLLGSKGGPGVPEDSFYLDDDIIERQDRKKQAFYEQFESVRFSSEAVLQRQAAGERALVSALAFAERQTTNVEPLLVNKVGSWALRPTSRTAIPNLLLAGDYVRTNTNLATMEAANESARRAVNEILKDAGFRGKYCTVWPLTPAADAIVSLQMLLFGTTSQTQTVYGDIPMRVVSEAASVATGVASRLLDRWAGRRPRT